jgi:nucleotide-binding universal stress UspA family protein
MVEATFPQRRDDPALLQHLSREDAERTGRARMVFTAAAQQYGLPLCETPGQAPVSLGWAESRSIFDETAEEAHYHDLVVMAREPELPVERVRSVLMQSGRPLLLAAPDRTPVIGRTIAIAWKASAEAARAVTAAASWLARAERVFILNVSWGACEERDRLSAERLAAGLRWDGIAAEVVTDRAQGREATTLQIMACDRDADLLVMGAYGHSRLREYVLGGVTESMLSVSALPVLMMR